jgi:hypothetical protein
MVKDATLNFFFWAARCQGKVWLVGQPGCGGFGIITHATGQSER